MFEIEMGVALLDEKFPIWHAKINLNTLALCDYWWCVLGQLYGSYGEGLRALGIEDDDVLVRNARSNALGFSCESVGDCTWDDLQEGWEKLILERRKSYGKSKKL
jgi:hypothetical protein